MRWAHRCQLLLLTSPDFSTLYELNMRAQLVASRGYGGTTVHTLPILIFNKLAFSPSRLCCPFPISLLLLYLCKPLCVDIVLALPILTHEELE